MFWDSSALVPLLVSEARTEGIQGLARDEGRMAIWWATPVECQTAIARRHRESPMPSSQLEQVTARITELALNVRTVAATEEVRTRARRLASNHPLRAADALQLAAALVSCHEQPVGESFVCLDDRLREAALREGFTVLPPAL